MQGRGATLGAGLLLLAALVGGAAWWLMPRGDVASLNERGAGRDSSALPGTPALSVVAEQAPVTIDAVESGSAATPTSSVAAPVDPVPFTGRVVDEAGRPVAGALVCNWPTRDVRTQRGLAEVGLHAPLDRARLAQSRTDAQGVFSVPVADPPPLVETLQRAIRTGGAAYRDDLVPELLVFHPDFEATLFPCRGWVSGPYAAGDLVLRPGVHVTGRALDEDGRPLAGAIAGMPPMLWRDELGARASEWYEVSKLLTVATGDDGRFVLDGLWPGAVTLSLLVPGLRPSMQWVVLEAGQTHDFGDVRLVRGPTLAGYVVDAGGRPVPGARVKVWPYGSQRPGDDGDVALQELATTHGLSGFLADLETRTDTSGAFRLTGLRPGLHPDAPDQPQPLTVAVSAEGYEPGLRRDVFAGGEAVIVTLQPAATLVLALVDAESGEPVEGATVAAGRIVPALMYREMRTAVAAFSAPERLQAAGAPAPWMGKFLLVGLGSHRNEALVSAPGYATQSHELPTLAPGERRNLTLALAHGARLSGRVLDPDGRPLAQARLELHCENGPDLPPGGVETLSDAQGRFAFEALPGGDYIVLGTAPSFVAAETVLISVRPAAAVEDVELVLPRAGAIAGVVRERGMPMPGAIVRARPAGDQPPDVLEERHGHVRGAQVGVDGRFRIGELAAGSYDLSGPPGVEQRIEVEAGRTTQVEIAARSRPRVRGLVSDRDGAVARAQIDALPVEASGAGGRASATSDATGRFEILLQQPGTYKLAASEGGSVTVPAEVSVDWDADARLDLRFGTGEVSGVLVDETGAPVVAADVRLTPAAPDESIPKDWSRTVRSDGQGRFTIARVPAGLLAVFPRHADCVVPQPLVAQVPENGAAPELRVSMQRAAVVRGRVSAVGPLGDELRVRCVPLAAQGKEARATVKADGSFECRQLAPGAWRCELYRRTSQLGGPVLSARELQLKPAETTTVDFVLD